MTFVGAYEAKTHLAGLLERANRGERITITKHGTPYAVLGPAAHAAATTVSQVIKEMREFRRGQALGGLSIRDMIEEGRRP